MKMNKLLVLLMSCVSGVAAASQTVNYTYDTNGHVLTEDGPRTDVNDVTTYTYDASGNRATATNALNQIIRYNSYDAAGRLLSVTDANNVTTEFTYHSRGWLLSSRVKNVVANGDALTTYGYDDLGQLISMTLPNGVQLSYEYDDARRLTAVKNNLNERIEYTLDSAGNRTQEIIKDSAGSIQFSVSRAFDELSRVMKLNGNHQQQQAYKYDANGNTTKITDGRSNSTQQNFDALNRVSKVIDQNLGETGITYDEKDRVKTVTDARGNVTTYNYDEFGNLISQTSPDTGVTTFAYDDAGNRKSATDARGVVVNYTYDALNRLKTISYSGASAENAVFGYDDTSPGAWGMNYGVGRLTKVENSSSIITFKYNAAGLLSAKRATINGITFVNYYAYDAANNLTSITYPSGRIVTYLRDSAGRVQSVKTKLNASAAEQTVVSGISYLPFGPANNYTFGNGLNHIANYDNDYRLTGIQVGGILNRSYGYDPVDNITNISDLVASSKNQTFAYDALNRLTSATGIYGVLGYTYDAVGNRLSEKTDNGTTHLNDTYIYPANSNRLTTINKTSNNVANGSRSFTYDAAGNRLQATTEDGKLQDYAYNKRNRLDTAKVAGVLVGTYGYDVLGQRISKTFANGEKELYQYDEFGQLIAVTDAAGKNSREYIYNGNQLVGFVNVSAAANSSSSSSSSSKSSSSSSSSKSSSSSSSLSSKSSSSTASIATITLDEATVSFVGSHAVGSGFAGFTGSGFIDYTGEGEAKWTFNVVTAASYTVSVRYALSGTTVDRPLTLLVDGVSKGNFSFPFTASWSTWANTTTITVALTAGSHTLSLKTNGQSGPNIDKVMITPVASGGAMSGATGGATSSTSSIAPIMRDEATAVLVGSHAIGSGFAGFTGSGFIDYNGEGQVNWPLTIVTSANYNITVRYALSGTTARPLALLVDGVQQATFAIAATTSWTTWTTETKTIALTAGSHTLSLKTTGQSGPNVDKVDIVAVVSSASSTSSSSSSSKSSSSSSSSSSKSSSSSSSSSSSTSSSSSSSAAATPVATLYFVHTDHLGTPQVITDKNQSVVFMADYQPFGKLQPNQTNSIELYSRFPGQFLDKETGLYYNYFRDYDASIGRYIESDPIGLEGGINTYAYVLNNPFSHIDPLGLATDLCTQPLHALGGKGAKSLADVSWNPLYHEYIQIRRPDGSVNRYGQDRVDGIWGKGKPSQGDGASPEDTSCKQVEPDNQCVESCITDVASLPRPNYALFLGGATNGGQNCQVWAEHTVEICKTVCENRKKQK